MRIYKPSRRSERIKHNSIVFSFAAISFIVVGIIMSFSISACVRQKEAPLEINHFYNPQVNITGQEEEQGKPPGITMPDSIIRICMPKPLKGVPEMILYRRAYIVSYNRETKQPNWVAWNLSAEHTDGPYQRLNVYHEDEEVPLPRATNDDYRGSGWSKGHMCPAGDNKWDEQVMFETFSLTNVCPQNASLNSGLWNSIEMDCRKWAKRFGDIYIVCGPVFFRKEHETIGENKIVVPEAFFKVVLCFKGKPKAFGIIARNTEGNKKRDLYYNTIDQVERITGYDFFCSLPDKLENEIEAADVNMDDWNKTYQNN